MENLADFYFFNRLAPAAGLECRLKIKVITEGSFRVKMWFGRQYFAHERSFSIVLFVGGLKGFRCVVHAKRIIANGSQ
jgi:hypothetical protein